MSNKLTKEDFVKRAIAKHGNKYDYSLVEYQKNSVKVKIICPEHGVFEQTPADHMAGKGCRKCGIIKNSKNRTMSQEKFIRIANEVHNGKYNYSRVVYKNMDTKVIIGCPIHGYFEQVPYSHIHMGYGCEKCGYVMTGNKLKKSQDKFIKEAKLVHGDKYDYSKVEYKNANTEVTIICPIHGEFKQLPYCHVNQKSGCYECGRLKSSNNRRIGIKKFVEDSRKSHTENYDYSKSVYVNSNTEIEIICPEHGSFFQLPILHRYGAKCPKCCGRNRTTEEYIQQARIVHGNKYNYFKTIYAYGRMKVIITCPEHGDFEQAASEHLAGRGCPKCANNVPISELEFLERARIKYGNKFDYSLMKYRDYRTPITIVCPEHGEFTLSPMYHLTYAMGCVACSRDKMSKEMSMTTEEFVERAVFVHGDRYDYSKVNYINSNYKVDIVCKKHNFLFRQDPTSHLSGCGCPKCNASKMELRIWRMLEIKGIGQVHQKTFEWLKYKSSLYLDFYLPEYNLAIECQGLQHFGIVKKGKMAFDNLEEIFVRDKIKYELCKEHGLKILYFCNEDTKYIPNDYLDKIYHTQAELMKEIKNYKKSE
jgi:very-short-patch-repair endonuclease|uniref:DUF723 domain-containing protein n=1 Tax=Prevotella sp. TaxID=59823 RepID=UPI004024DA25